MNLKPHMVLLNDETRSQLLLGFEDVPRDWAMCDNDFNDAIFYKHTIKTSKEEIRKFVAVTRYDLASEKTKEAKELLDSYIYY